MAVGCWIAEFAVEGLGAASNSTSRPAYARSVNDDVARDGLSRKWTWLFHDSPGVDRGNQQSGIAGKHGERRAGDRRAPDCHRVGSWRESRKNVLRGFAVRGGDSGEDGLKRIATWPGLAFSGVSCSRLRPARGRCPLLCLLPKSPLQSTRVIGSVMPWAMWQSSTANCSVPPQATAPFRRLAKCELRDTYPPSAMGVPRMNPTPGLLYL